MLNFVFPVFVGKILQDLHQSNPTGNELDFLHIWNMNTKPTREQGYNPINLFGYGDTLQPGQVTI